MSPAKPLVKWALAVLMFGALSGCASVSMQKASLADAASPEGAIVTFVRPAVFFGDGQAVDIWDGDRYVGSLAAGTLIQHQTTPGSHVFLGDAENWSYLKANLLPGKSYYVKANIFPGAFGNRIALAAVPKDDARVAQWLKELTPMSALPEQRDAHAAQHAAEVREALNAYNAGEVKSAELRAEDGR